MVTEQEIIEAQRTDDKVARVSREYIIERAETLGYCTRDSALDPDHLCLYPKPCFIHDYTSWYPKKADEDSKKRTDFINTVVKGL